ncbi:MAG: HWE histidine kinase domain-containing protein, partial [Pseudomonadota bacterium]
MSRPLTDEEVSEALDGCASEPAHIPGMIQPFGFLLGADIATGLVQYISENCAEFFAREPSALFGCHLRDLLSPDVWHAIQNIASLRDFADRRYFAGHWTHRGTGYAVHVSKGGETFVVEIEDGAEGPTITPEMLREQTFLVNQIQGCEDEATLLDLTMRLLRHLTGFDRVMAYKFDEEWNGEILAEARKPSLNSLMGLRFPHWDIPAQARAIMGRIQLRLIGNVDQDPVAILADSPQAPPLDMTFAQLRGISEVHMQYLRNMGLAASMTLSVVLDGKLWGMISFHHRRPKIAPTEIRQILTTGVLPVFCLKLGLLRDRRTLALSQRLDKLQSDLQADLERGTNVAEMLDKIGPSILEDLSVDGITITSGEQSFSHGLKPATVLLDHLVAMARSSEDGAISINSIAESLPDFADHANDVAGVLAVGHSNDRGLLVYRRSVIRHVAWAGNPTKVVETVDGNKRLQPRGSFTRYLEQAEDRCEPWSLQDKHLTEHLFPLLSAAERQAFMNRHRRHQQLMIEELNHRVRNILALVKSVSQGARREGGSLDSYSRALEARIHALAAAHDLGSGVALSAVSVRKIIALETKAFADSEERVVHRGEDFSVRADQAPIFALVIHELMTNAVKYGALSNDRGKIDIHTHHDSAGATLDWVETDGPEVTQPRRRGFGTTLIWQAMPFEMDGRSTLEFERAGLCANLWLPAHLLDHAGDDRPGKPSDPVRHTKPIPDAVRNGLVLILEDNFMIATDLSSELEQLGFPNTELFARAEDAMDFLRTGDPVLAFLDINLGQGRTSEVVATELAARKQFRVREAKLLELRGQIRGNH